MRFGIGRTFALGVLCLALPKSIAEEPIVIASGHGAQTPKQPQAAIGPDGTVHVVFGIEDAVHYCQSSDGGITFHKARQSFRVSNMALGMRRGPRVAATADAIVVTAIGGTIGKGRDGDVGAWRSKDAGKTWHGPIRVNDVADSAREGLHAMASGKDGSIWCVWLDLRDRKSEIYATVSTDGGASWSPNVCVYRSPDGSVCECCHPSITVTDDGMHVMFRNSLDGNRDMYVVSSTDSGKSFTAATKLGHGTWSLNACPMDGGMLAAGSQRIVETVWRRDEEVYWARGDGSAEVLLGRGQQPWITATATGSIITWTSGREGDLLVREPGSAKTRVLSKAARDAMVASTTHGDGPAIACWESKSGSDSTIVAQRIDVGKARSR